MTLRPRGREAMLAGAAIAAYIIAVRPWHLRWSATPEEVTRALPGDQLVAQPVTRPPMRSPSVPRHRHLAVAGPAGPEPRGLYSYQWLENLAGCKLRTTDRIVPRLQQLEVGDLVRLGPDPTPAITVWSIQPTRRWCCAPPLRTATAPSSGRPRLRRLAWNLGVRLGSSATTRQRC